MAQEKNYQLSPEDLQKVMSSIDIPACPAILSEAMSEAQKDEPDLARLADIITSDAGMSAAALKLANSPMFGINGNVTGVRKAVDRLGTKNVVCVVVSVALRSSMGGLPASWLDQFWRRTSQLALAASLIAKRQFGISPDAAYTYALFHDAAIPLMMKRFPNYTEVIDRARETGESLNSMEEQYFPCTHPIIGSLLVRNWGLPPLLGQAIRFHHEQDLYELPDRTLPGGALSLIAVTQVAEHLIGKSLNQCDIEVGNELFAKALDFLGICPDEHDELLTLVESALAS